MRRRALLISAVGLLVCARPARGQPRRSPARLAILSPDSSSSSESLPTFLRALRELGYVDGENLNIEFRFAENQLDRLPELASELVAWKPDVIYTYTSGGARAAAIATRRIPIVVGAANETVLLALVGNLARPVGNVTGLALDALGQYEKCLELLKELSPRALLVGVLLNPDNPAWADYPAILNLAADRLGLVLVKATSRGQTDIDDTLMGLDGEKLDALLLTNDSVFFNDDRARARIIEFARDRHLPSATTNLVYPRRGGLLALGTDQAFLRRRAAEFGHRIIEGGRPGDLPVERPTKYQLSVNLLAAKAIGVTIPSSLLARADEVIE